MANQTVLQTYTEHTTPNKEIQTLKKLQQGKDILPMKTPSKREISNKNQETMRIVMDDNTLEMDVHQHSIHKWDDNLLNRKQEPTP
jgi:hypothetical protein